MMDRTTALRYLKLPTNANASQIKRAHRTLAKLLHPDRPNGDATAFKKMQEAFETLSNEAGTHPLLDSDRWESDNESDWHPHAAHDNWTWLDHALYEAVWENDVETTSTLLKQGAKPDAYQNDVWGGTTLMLAAQHGNMTLVKLLLAHGATVLPVDSGGIDAVKWAKRRKRLEHPSILKTCHLISAMCVCHTMPDRLHYPNSPPSHSTCVPLPQVGCFQVARGSEERGRGRRYEEEGCPMEGGDRKIALVINLSNRSIRGAGPALQPFTRRRAPYKTSPPEPTSHGGDLNCTCEFEGNQSCG